MLTVHQAAFVEALGDGGDVVWKVAHVNKWLKDVDQFVLMLCIYTHVTCGQPARAQEICSLVVHNTATSQRSVFYAYDTVCLLQRYAKTNSINDRNSFIARFVAKECRDLFLQYLIIVRPLYLYVPLLNRFRYSITR
jgi:hypothetical protein